MQLGDLHIAFVGAAEVFDPAAHRRSDAVFYSAKISESEGDFPILELELENLSGGAVDRQAMGRVFVSIDTYDDAGGLTGTELMFAGLLTGFPIGAAGEMITLRFEARPVGWAQLQLGALAGVGGVPFRDPLFGNPEDPLEAVDAIPSMVHWDRATNAPSLSSIYGSAGLIDLAWWDRQSLKLDMTGMPLEAVHIRIKAEWEQRDLWFGELDQAIADAFDEVYGLSTYTPEALEDAWPKVGDTVGSDYVVTSSALPRIAKPAGAPAQMTASQAAETGKSYTPGDTQPKQMVFRRTYLQPDLQIAAGRTTKRTETVSFSLFNGGQAVTTAGDEETIELDLAGLQLDQLYADWQPGVRYGNNAHVSFLGFTWRCIEAHDSTTSLWSDLEYEDPDEPGTYRRRWVVEPFDGSALGSPAASVFFSTERGRQAIDHAILVAAAKIASSQRCVEVGITTDLSECLGIRCANMMRIEGDVLPAGDGSATPEILGKVTDYTITITADGGAWVEITLQASTGSGAAGGAGPRAVQHFAEAWSRIAYEPPVYLGPAQAPFGLHRVRIINGPEDQFAAVSAQAVPNGTGDIANTLQDNPTAIELETYPAEGGETSIHLTLAPSAFQGFRGVSL